MAETINPTIQNGQTCLEKIGLSQRISLRAENTYKDTNEYSEIHEDSKSNGQPQGKRTAQQPRTWLLHATADTVKQKSIRTK